jgi:hypothetical protein
MRVLIFGIALILGAGLSQAQQLERSVIGSAGSQMSAGNLRLSFTVGEAVIEKKDNASTELIQGFHARAAKSINTIVEAASDRLKVLPNPFRSSLSFIGDVKVTKMDLYSMDGRLVFSANVNGGELLLPELPSGPYVLQLRNDNAEVFRYRLMRQ